MGRRVLAFDVATHCGYALVEDTDPMPRVINSGVIDLTPIRVYEKRLLYFFRECVMIIGTSGPVAAILYETPPGWQGKTQAATLRTLWQLAAVVQLAVAHSGTEATVWGVDPNQWHRLMIGHGLKRAQYKALAILQVQQRTGYQTDREDEADAIMVALYGLGLMRLGMLEARLAHAR